MMTPVKWIYTRTPGQMFLIFLGVWAVLYLALFFSVGLLSDWDGGSWLTIWPIWASSNMALLVSLVLVWCRWVLRRRAQ